MRSNNKRPKPFVSKQTRHITGKKNKPGHPTFPRQVEGEKQFYLFGYVFSTKKELKDRVKQLLRTHHSLTNNLEVSAPDLTNGRLINNPYRPDPPGGLIKRLQENNDKIKSLLFKPPSNVTSINIDTFSSPTVFSLLQQLVLRHPNYDAWSNKNIVFFTTGIEEKFNKLPPLLWGHFKGNENKPRKLKWSKCLLKQTPTLDDKLQSALWFHAREQTKEIIFSSEKVSVCQRCFLDRKHIDNVDLSYPFGSAQFHVVCRNFFQGLPQHFQNSLDDIKRRLQWIKKNNSFSFHPVDHSFKMQWLDFHSPVCKQMVWLCETCRIEAWCHCLFFDGSADIDKHT